MKLNTPSDFYTFLLTKFPFELNPTQKETLADLCGFVYKMGQDDIFMLKGYAGTGKTTLVAMLVSHLWEIKKGAILLAPTGRAAKVMSNYAGTEASTIHKKIYFPKKQGNGSIQFVLAPNKHKNSFFIVDEASMISDLTTDSNLLGNASLLEDLIQYVDSGNKCKLVLVGDTAQLPPVHLDVSPALDANTLETTFQKNVVERMLTQVMRQGATSGILKNATLIRQSIQNQVFGLQIELRGYNDIVRLIDGSDIQEAIEQSYAQQGREETVILLRSNKRANLYNKNIRERILFLDNEVTVGDYLMVVKNNYFWVKANSPAGFIANGDIIEILELFKIKDLYGFRFAEVRVRMVDYPNQKPFETVLLLDTLKSEKASLSFEQGQQLYQEVLKDYAELDSKYKQLISVKQNKYFNALQVKFSYAITCHKSQGGQWHTVFVEQPYAANGIDKEYLRWLYTAMTRAKEKLYLIGFKQEYFLE